MIYKLLKANYVNKNNVSYSEECINKMIEQYKDKKFNVYCAKEIDVSEYNDTSNYYKDKTIYIDAKRNFKIKSIIKNAGVIDNFDTYSKLFY